jgi:hypothetical protein
VTALALDGPTVVQLERVLERDRAAMPFCDAVTRRLGVESWMLRLDAGGRVRGVVVLGADVAVGVRAPPEPDSAREARVRASAPDDPLERVEPVRPGGPLARLLGTTQATGRQLADLALRSDDPEVRGEAVAVGVDAIVRDPVLEQRVLAGLDGVDDATLARTVRGIAGDATAGLLAVVEERARGRPLGDRAARIRATLTD